MADCKFVSHHVLKISGMRGIPGRRGKRGKVSVTLSDVRTIQSGLSQI